MRAGLILPWAQLRTEEFKGNRTGDKESSSSKEYVELWWSHSDKSNTTEVFREHLTANIPTATLVRAGSKQTSNNRILHSWSP